MESASLFGIHRRGETVARRHAQHLRAKAEPFERDGNAHPNGDSQGTFRRDPHDEGGARDIGGMHHRPDRVERKCTSQRKSRADWLRRGRDSRQRNEGERGSHARQRQQKRIKRVHRKREAIVHSARNPPGWTTHTTSPARSSTEATATMRRGTPRAVVRR